MNKEKENYLKTICNFLNNVKGSIDFYEVKFLLEYVNEERIDLTEDNIYKINKLIDLLSDYVKIDNQEEFAKIINVFKEDF